MGERSEGKRYCRPERTKGLQCYAINCYSYHNKEFRAKGISFHKFPDKEKYKDRYATWVRNCRRQKEPSRHSKLCSKHFEPDMINKTLTIGQLREHAVPTIFDFPQHLQPKKAVKRKSRTSLAAMDDLPSAGETDISPEHAESDCVNRDLVVQTPEPVEVAMDPGPLTTHILDTARGKPATDVPIQVSKQNDDGQYISISQGRTNEDGRCPGLLTHDQFTPGVYQIHFDTKSYFTSLGVKGFYPFVNVVFEIEDSSQHYHVPLLLSPYGYSTYRGS